VTSVVSANRFRRRRRGVAAVEFAMIAPVLFMLIFGIFELTRVTMVQQAITNAAREGCRVATLATTNSTELADARIRVRLDGVIPRHLDRKIVNVQFSPATLASIASKTQITTTVEVNYGDISLLPGWLLGNSRLSVSVTMQRE
jgi:Flp pilus assembly protein TadG